jgi:putative membrane protein
VKRSGKAAVFGALGLGLANGFFKPLLLALALPITILTFGLFVFVVNALMLMLAAAFVDGLEVKGFSAAIWGALALDPMKLVVGMFFGL